MPEPNAFNTPQLTPEQHKLYQRDGYIVGRWQLFSPEKLSALQELGREYAARADGGEVAPDLNVPHFTDSRFFDFLLDPAVLDVVEQLLGPDIALWSSQFFCKRRETGRLVPWHSDGYYWTNFIRPVNVLSVFVALDPSNRVNGCLRLLPGSLDRNAFTYRASDPDADPFFPKGVADSDIDAEEVVDVELEPGEFVLFDGNLLHGSTANTSGADRYCFTLRYAPTSCNFASVGLNPARRVARFVAGGLRQLITGKPFYQHQVYLARGVDRGNNRYAKVPNL